MRSPRAEIPNYTKGAEKRQQEQILLTHLGGQYAQMFVACLRSSTYGSHHRRTCARAPGHHYCVQRASFFVSPRAHQASPCRRRATTTRVACGNQHVEDSSHEGEEDTIRVKIWRALASGEEMRLSELGNTVGVWGSCDPTWSMSNARPRRCAISQMNGE